MGFSIYERQSSEARKREALHEKFRKLLIKGKARFNMLRAALSRKEALATFQKLVHEEGAAPTYSKSTRALTDNSRCRIAHDVQDDEPGIGNMDFHAQASATKDSEETSGAPPVTAKVANVSQVAINPSQPQTREHADVFDERLRFRSQGSPSTDQPETFVSIRLSQSCYVRGWCLISSRGVIYNDRVSAWRFLYPGVSAVRFEFRILERDGIVVCIDDFVTDPTKQASVDVRLDGQLIAASRSHGRPANFIQLEPLDDTRHLLEIALCQHESAAWAYHLRSVTISRPPSLSRDLPRTDEISKLLSSLPDIHFRKEEQIHRDALVASYKQGFRDRLLEKQRA